MESHPAQLSNHNSRIDRLADPPCLLIITCPRYRSVFSVDIIFYNYFQRLALPVAKHATQSILDRNIIACQMTRESVTDRANDSDRCNENVQRLNWT